MNRPANTSAIRHAAALVSAFILTACSTTRTLLSLESGYEKTRLPVHLDEARYADDMLLSVSVGSRDQDVYTFATQNSVPIKVRNSAYAADVSLHAEADIFHFGLQAGASPTDRGLLRFGGYSGFQVDVAPYVVGSVSGGMFVNSSANRTTYTHSETFFILPTPDEERSENGTIMRLEVPLRANLIVDTKTFVSPFVSYSYNRIGIGVRKAGAVVVGHEIATGAMVKTPWGACLTVEGALSRDGVVDRPALSGRRTTERLMGFYVTAAQEF